MTECPPRSFFAVSHLYIHIPFCHRVCPYCGFFKHTPGATDMRGFVAAVAREAELRLPEGAAPRTIYFGGGTPSMLSPKLLGDLVAGLQRHIDTSCAVEWSFEANPATFTAAKVEHWRQLGINRVSLGAQSFEQRLLKLLGREHTPEQIVDSVRLLREVGMPQVNLDFMFCLPQQSAEEWRHTLERALELQPEHVSTYSLTLEEGTPYAAAYPAPDEETEVQLYTLAHELMVQAGYRHYEISNFARSSADRSEHNLAYWRGADYYGLGPGACGTVNGVRYMNAPDTAAYTAALSCGSLPPGSQESLTPEQRHTELLGLGLRMDEGVPIRCIAPEQGAILQGILDEGLAREHEGRLILSPKGMLLADEIATALMPTGV